MLHLSALIKTITSHLLPEDRCSYGRKIIAKSFIAPLAQGFAKQQEIIGAFVRSGLSFLLNLVYLLDLAKRWGVK